MCISRVRYANNILRIKLMNKKILIFFVALLVILILAIFPFATNAFSQNKEFQKIKDLAGREIEVPQNVNRIVCAGPGALRIIVYLEAEDIVIGVEDAEKRWGFSGRPYVIAHPQLAQLPPIGSGGPGKLPDTESLIKLNPEVIFMTYVDKRIADNIQSKTRIPVVILSYGELSTFSEPFYESVQLAGKILQKQKRANQVVEYLRENIEDLEHRTKDIPEKAKPSVYVGGIGFKGSHGIDSTQVGFPPFDFVNAKSVADNLGKMGNAFIDKEKLLEWDPEVIFIDEGGFELIKQDFKKNPEFYKALGAFKKGKVYGTLPFNFYTTNIGTALADAVYIGKVLYPQKFSDILPEEKADEIYTFLVGKPVYSKMKNDFGGFGRIYLE